MFFTVMAALSQMELGIKRERIDASIPKRRADGGRSSPTARAGIHAASSRMVNRSHRCDFQLGLTVHIQS